MAVTLKLPGGRNIHAATFDEAVAQVKQAPNPPPLDALIRLNPHHRDALQILSTGWSTKPPPITASALTVPSRTSGLRPKITDPAPRNHASPTKVQSADASTAAATLQQRAFAAGTLKDVLWSPDRSKPPAGLALVAIDVDDLTGENPGYPILASTVGLGRLSQSDEPGTLITQLVVMAAKFQGSGMPFVQVTTNDDKQYHSFLGDPGDGPHLDLVKGGYSAAESGSPPSGITADGKHQDLVTFLREQGVQTVILMGTDANTCVAATAIDLHHAGFKLITANDLLMRASQRDIREHLLTQADQLHVTQEDRTTKGWADDALPTSPTSLRPSFHNTGITIYSSAGFTQHDLMEIFNVDEE